MLPCVLDDLVIESTTDLQIFSSVVKNNALRSGELYHEDLVIKQTTVETRSVPMTITRSERDFAILDHLLRQNPIAWTISFERMVLYDITEHQSG